MRRSSEVLLTTTMMAAAATACAAEEEATHQAVCVDRTTETVLDDSQCDDHDVDEGDRDHDGDNHSFIFLHTGGYMPGVGQRLGANHGGGSYQKPSTPYVRGGAPRAGGTVPRGGFGGGAKAGG